MMRPKRKVNKVILLGTGIVFTLLGGLAVNRCEAQDTFGYRVDLDTVKQAGFYKVTLQPDLIAKCREDLSDLRIRNKEGKFVPYVLKSDLPVFATENFREFPILFNKKLKDSSTEVVIANESAGSLQSLLLVIRNISARRTAVLSGSDDRQKWWVIREHIELQEAGSDTADHYVQSITFPASNYRYFKIILDDKGLLPINILKAGMRTQNFTNGKYLGVAYPAITQKDSSNKHSYITLQYRDRYRIDKLDLIIQRPGLYKRRAWIYDNTNGVAGRQPVAEITISPAGTSFAVSPVKTNSLLLDIANEDDAPLVIQAVKTAQLNQYLLTYLQTGDRYCLLGGNAHTTAPDYDLKYFTDSLTMDPQELLSGPLKPESSNKGPVAPAAKDPSRTFLWVVLGLVLVVLAFLSLKMIQSISEKDTHDRV